MKRPLIAKYARHRHCVLLDGALVTLLRAMHRKHLYGYVLKWRNSQRRVRVLGFASEAAALADASLRVA
jgi:hypothetical protein